MAKDLNPIQSYKHSDLDNFSPKSYSGPSGFLAEQQRIADEEKARADALKDEAEAYLDGEAETGFQAELQVKAGRRDPFPVATEPQKDPTAGSLSHSMPSSSDSTPTNDGKSEPPAKTQTTQTPSSPSVGN